jgi:hypothetical protein
MFNTNSLGYKLLNRVVKDHSEQLNKVVAGLFDSDGCVSIKFNSNGSSSYNNAGYYRIQLCAQIDQSASNDPDLTMIRGIRDHYNLGTLNYHARENWAHQTTWQLGAKEAQVLFGLIGKHMYIKRAHFENLIWLYNELKGVRLSEDQLGELKEFIACSRDISCSLSEKKHISPAYLAGLIAGDGWITVRLNIPRLRNGWLCHENQMNCAVSVHELDSKVLEQIQKDYGGNITLKDGNMKCWKLGLGKQYRAMAIRFTSDLMKYMCLPKKYTALERIYDFHTLPAETKCSGSEKRCDSPRR